MGLKHTYLGHVSELRLPQNGVALLLVTSAVRYCVKNTPTRMTTDMSFAILVWARLSRTTKTATAAWKPHFLFQVEWRVLFWVFVLRDHEPGHEHDAVVWGEPGTITFINKKTHDMCDTTHIHTCARERFIHLLMTDMCWVWESQPQDKIVTSVWSRPLSESLRCDWCVSGCVTQIHMR